MTTWYEADNHYGCRINPVEVARETEHSVWLKSSHGAETRRERVSSYSVFFPTLAEAVSHVRQRLEVAVERAKQRVIDSQKELNGFNAKYADDTAEVTR